MALVTVEDQSRSDLFFLCSLGDGLVDQDLGILTSEFVGHNETIKQILDGGEVAPTLLGQYIGHIRDPLLVRLHGAEVSVENILVAMIGVQLAYLFIGFAL